MFHIAGLMICNTHTVIDVISIEASLWPFFPSCPFHANRKRGRGKV